MNAAGLSEVGGGVKCRGPGGGGGGRTGGCTGDVDWVGGWECSRRIVWAL